jgi:hypothetical protein
MSLKAYFRWVQAVPRPLESTRLQTLYDIRATSLLILNGGARSRNEN